MKRLVRLLLPVLAVLLISCSSQEEESGPEDTKVYPDHESWNSSIVITKAGLKRAVVNSGHLKKFNASAVIQMDEGVLVDFFDVAGDTTSHLTSDSATVNERTNDLIAVGHVIVVSDSGGTLFTERLRWDNKKEKIITKDFVTFVTEHDTLTGFGFESDGALDFWTIFQPAGVTDRELKK